MKSAHKWIDTMPIKSPHPHLAYALLCLALATGSLALPNSIRAESAAGLSGGVTSRFRDEEDARFLPVEAYPMPGLRAAPVPSPECIDTAGAWYVDDVADSGDGSLGSPFNNVQAALDVVQPGDAIYILPGAYTISLRLQTKTHGSQDNPICLRAYDPNNPPVIQRANGTGENLITIRHMYYVLDGIVFDGRFTPESNASLVQIHRYGVAGSTDNGDHTILRNCVVRNNRRNGISVSADHVLIENCEIHHHLRGSMADPVDAHGVVASHETDLTVRYCDIHHVSGDSLQTDPDIHNTAGTKLWDQVSIEHTRMWTGPLAADAGDWRAGDNPGENAVDTKTFEAQPLPHRPQITLHNVEVFGFSDTANSRRAAFNIKYNVDWFIEGVTVYDNEIAFRARGPWDNAAQGGAHAAIQNFVAYDNDIVFRYERDIEQLRLYHGTLANNQAFSQHADCPTDPCYDEASFALSNNLFLGPKPAEAGHPSNLSGDPIWVQDATSQNYTLVSTSPAIDAGMALAEVNVDRAGEHRPQGKAWDVGAFEYLPELVLSGAPASQVIRLTWEVNYTLPFTTTWQISYAGPPGNEPSPIIGILNETRAYTLTGLTNYTWYTVTLSTEPAMLMERVRLMPTDNIIYLPMIEANRSSGKDEL
jgi:hypothetical protein